MITIGLALISRGLGYPLNLKLKSNKLTAKIIDSNEWQNAIDTVGALGQLWFFPHVGSYGFLAYDMSDLKALPRWYVFDDLVNPGIFSIMPQSFWTYDEQADRIASSDYVSTYLLGMLRKIKGKSRKPLLPWTTIEIVDHLLEGSPWSVGIDSRDSTMAFVSIGGNAFDVRKIRAQYTFHDQSWVRVEMGDILVRPTHTIDLTTVYIDASGINGSSQIWPRIYKA